LRALMAATAGEYSTMYLIDEYTTVSPGDPFRLFPFGKIVKDGREIIFTPEMAKLFRLPHFKPPIKRGSHNEDAPAGGFIIGLDVREDGLYAIPEYNEKGLQAIQDGDYRYQSPEVVWDDGPVFEDPKTGELLYGPMIVGDALLHTPHLGEAAALYQVQPITREEKMTEQLELVEVPRKWYEGILDVFKATKPEPTPEPEPETAVEVEMYEAAVQERDEYKAQLDRMAAEVKQTERIGYFTTALAETKANGELAEMLAELPEETAERFVQEFKALSEQIKESALTGEIGTDGGNDLPDNPLDRLNAVIKVKQAEHSIGYNAALDMIRNEQPDLVKAAYG